MASQPSTSLSSQSLPSLSVHMSLLTPDARLSQFPWPSPSHPPPLSPASINVPRLNIAMARLNSNATGKENVPRESITSDAWAVHGEHIGTLKRQKTEIMQTPRSLQGAGTGEPWLASSLFILESPTSSTTGTMRTSAYVFSPPLSSSSLSLSSPSFFTSPPLRVARAESGLTVDVDMVPETPPSAQGTLARRLFVPGTASSEEEEQDEKKADHASSSGDWEGRIAAAQFLAETEVEGVSSVSARAAGRTVRAEPRGVASQQHAEGKEEKEPWARHQAVSHAPGEDQLMGLQRTLSARTLIMREKRREMLSHPLFDGCRWTVQDLVVSLQKIVVSTSLRACAPRQGTVIPWLLHGLLMSCTW